VEDSGAPLTLFKPTGSPITEFCVARMTANGQRAQMNGIQPGSLTTLLS